MTVHELTTNAYRYRGWVEDTHTAPGAWPKDLKDPADRQLYHAGQVYAAYVQHMGRLGSWGDHTSLAAALAALKATATVVSTLGRHLDMEVAPHKHVSVERRVVLVHAQDVHYDGVRPLQQGRW